MNNADVSFCRPHEVLGGAQIITKVSSQADLHSIHAIQSNARFRLFEWRAVISVASKTLEAFRIEFGIKHGVLDVLVAEIALDGAGILPSCGELVAFGVAEHVRVDRKPYAGIEAGAGDQGMDGAR